ncbi:hypothetical protein [Paenibacillus lautus]|uniref:hypothetical protein n=1 Tax=Paenibacillus lautus TaxID=1401 RepID=UPI003D2688D2
MDLNVFLMLSVVIVMGLFFGYLLLKLLIKDYAKIFISVFFKTAILSMFLILLFTCVYIVIFAIDFTTVKSSLGDGKVTLDQIIKNKDMFNVRGIDYIHISKNWFNIFIDLFVFSFTTYIHLNTNIYLVGELSLFTTLEGFLGYIVPFLFIIILMDKKNREDDLKINSLEIFLNRGWSILSMKLFEKNYYNIKLVNESRIIKKLIIKSNSGLEEIYNNFKVTWDFKDDLSKLDLFLDYLEDEIYELKLKGSVSEIIGHKIALRKNDIRDYSELYSTLERFLNENIVELPFDLYKTIASIMSTIKKENDNRLNIDSEMVGRDES